MSTIPPSWEVLDQEARAHTMSITLSHEEEGRTYVNYDNGQVSASYLDHPIGRMSAQEMFEKLEKGQG